MRINKEEKLIKRYLKRKISLNNSIIVKYLITGLIGFIFTSCNLSSDFKTNDRLNNSFVIEDRESFQSNAELFDFTNLSGEIKEGVNLSVNGENSTAVSISGNDYLGRILTNNGNIKISGNESKGIFGKLNGHIINNGNITGESKNIISENTTPKGENYELTKKIENEKLYGIKSEKNGTIYNFNNISLKGNGEGISVSDTSTGLNSGNINLISGTKKLEFYYYLDGKLINKQIQILKDEMIGLKGVNNSIAVNDKLGNIDIKGSGVGIFAKNNSTGENNGKIKLTSEKNLYEDINGNWEEWSQIYGIFVEDNSVGINNGDILIENNGIGIKGSGNFEIENNGNIEILCKDSEFIYSNIGISGDSNSKEMGKIFNRGLINIKSIDKKTLVIGINTKNCLVVNRGKIVINGDNSMGIVGEKTNIYNDGEIFVEGSNSIGIKIFNESMMLNNGDINVKGDNSIGIYSYTSQLINNGMIVVDGYCGIKDDISLLNEKLENNGDIFVTGDGEAIGIKTTASTLFNGGNITVKGDVKSLSVDNYQYVTQGATGILATNIDKLINNGDLLVEGNGTLYDGIRYGSTGIFALGSGAIENKGNMIVNGNYSTGILGKVKETKNYGDIEVSGTNSIGMIQDKIYSKMVNFGNIQVNGNNSIGMWDKKGGTIINESAGVIKAKDKQSIGILLSSFNSKGKNLGIITMEESDSIGMFAKDIGEVINENSGNIEVKKSNSIGMKMTSKYSKGRNFGNISVDGKGSIGMLAENGAIAVNESTGFIEVGKDAYAGMVSRGKGSRMENFGTIVIEEGSTGKDIIAENGGTFINYGNIKSEDNLLISALEDGKFIIGTDENGNYGKIYGKSVSLDGEIKVSADITKSSFANEYILQNIVDSEDIILEKGFTFTSTSLLYDATAKKDTWGNLDGVLTRNDKVLSDFTSGYLTSVGKIFEKYASEEYFKNLSSDAKEVIRYIDTENVQGINNSLDNLVPKIYANLGREMLDISETFKEEGLRNSENLKDKEYSFAVIGKYEDIESRDNIEGYNSKLSGFIGTMNFHNGLYGSIGFAYKDINYSGDSEGNIKTLHLGVNKYVDYKKINLKVGILGEYNFHENTRGVIDRYAHSDFNSYSIRGFSEISKKFGEKIYFKPVVSLDLAHMKYDSFSEANGGSLNSSVDSQSYTSIVPKGGLLLGGKIKKIDIYTGVEYSYELGDMDKIQTYKYKEFSSLKGVLPKDNLENEMTSLKVGVQYTGDSFIIKGDLRKTFGKNKNNFVDLSLSYLF